MNEYLSLYDNPAVDRCRRCLLTDFCGCVPKRLGEVLADMNDGEVEGLQCSDCQLSQVEFDQFVTALYAAAMIGDDMGDA